MREVFRVLKVRGLLGCAALLVACAQDRAPLPPPAAPTPPEADLSCSLQVAPAAIVIPRDRWTGDVSIDTKPGCPWTATSTVRWLTVSTSAGSGPTLLTYNAEFNPQTEYSARRMGAIEIRWPASSTPQTVQLTQWGDCYVWAGPAKDGLPAGAAYSSAPGGGTLTVAAQGGRVHFWVLTDPFMGCAWTAESDDAWILWSTPRMHQIVGGDGDLVFTVPAKSGSETRPAVVTLGGRFRLNIVQ